jgi:hypothetical protein
LLVYWVLFLVFAAGSLLNQEGGVGRNRLIFLLLVSVPTIAMIGLRWEVGPDWPGYYLIFTYTRLFSLNQAISHSDPGFYSLVWLLHRLHSPFWILNLVCGTVFVAGLTAFAQRQPNPWLAFLVAFPYLVIVVAMSGNRQSVALGFMFFALNAFERRQLLRFFVLIMIAALFHGSALLIIPVCLLSYTHNNFQKILLIVLSSVIGYYFLHSAFDIYADRYASYKVQSTGVFYRLSMNSLAAICFIIFGRRLELEEHQRRLWQNFSACTLGLILVLVFFPSSTAVDRFLLYLFPLQFVVLSRLPGMLTADRRAPAQLTLLVIAYSASVQVVFLMLGKFAIYYVPYQTIFHA